jgi:anti-anti-sigma regulatory factor
MIRWSFRSKVAASCPTWRSRSSKSWTAVPTFSHWHPHSVVATTVTGRALTRTLSRSTRAMNARPARAGWFFPSLTGSPLALRVPVSEAKLRAEVTTFPMKQPYRARDVWLPMPVRRPSSATGSGETPSVRANELSVETRQAGPRTILVTIGRVTVDSSPHLRAVLHDAIGAAASGGVTIDFTGTSHLDTSAVATLLEAATLASARGVELRVLGLHGDARFVAEGAELDRIFLALGYEVQFT